MGTITLIPPVAGTPAVAGTFTTAFTTIQTLANGNIDNNNINAAAAIALSKLAATVPYIYDRATTTVDVQTSAAETSLYTKAVTGGDMGTNRCLRLHLSGDFLKNNVAGDTLRLKVKFGGITLFDDTATFGATVGANRQPWEIMLTLKNLGAANSQFLSGTFTYVAPNTVAPTAGIGDLVGTTVPNMFAATPAIDTASAQTLDVTVQWSASSANNSWRMRYGVLELV